MNSRRQMTSLGIQPVLSVCIPTYNRARLLGELLDALAAQITGPLCRQVEVLVSDNASSDETGDTIRRIRDAHPLLPLTYSRQASNLGADANIYSVMQSAAGQYIYVVADDDILLPGAVSKLLSLIEAHPSAGAFCLNICAFTDSVSELGPPRFALREDTAFTDPNQALEFLSTWITFLSIIAFRRSVLTQHDYSEGIGTNLVQARIFLDALFRSGVFWVTKEPALAVRTDNTGSYSFFSVFVTQFAALLRYAEQGGYSPASVRRVHARHLRGFVLSCIITNKLRGSQGRSEQNYPDGVRRLLATYGFNPFVIGVLIPLMLTPSGLLKPLRPLAGRIRRLRWSRPGHD